MSNPYIGLSETEKSALITQKAEDLNAYIRNSTDILENWIGEILRIVRPDPGVLRAKIEEIIEVIES